MSSNFRYQHFVAFSENLGVKVALIDDVLLSHEGELYRITSLERNCIEFQFQTDRNSYVDLRQTQLALKLNFVKGCLYEIYNSVQFRKEHKDGSKADDEATLEEDEEPLIRLVARVKDVLV